MQLWQKTFLCTMLVCTAILYACIFVIADASFRSALDVEKTAATNEHQYLGRRLGACMEEEGGAVCRELAVAYAARYRDVGAYLQLEWAGQRYSSFPSELAAPPPEAGRRVGVVTVEGRVYLLVSGWLGSTTEASLAYLKELDILYAEQNRYALLLLALATAAALVMTAGLYFALRRIYRPIDALAHELRTPLTTIRGYAEYLRTAALPPEEVEDAAQYIIDESRRLADTSEKLLLLSGLREGRVTLKNVDIQEVFASVQQRYPQVVWQAEARQYPGDRTLLTCLVENLVKNACQAGARHVWLTAVGDVLTVEDDGSGMPPAQLEQVNAGRPSGGCGIGLSLCRDIARLHSARLQFALRPGGGTCVTLTFKFTKP